MRSRGWLFAGGMTAGVVAGWVFAQRRLSSHRRDLFSPRPLRRLAALAYLAGEGDVETVRLLRDYLAWERQPMLRRRAEGLLRRMEASLRMSGASSWAFREEDSRRITEILRTFLGESSARTALIVDRTGQLVSTVGEPPAFDPTAFASLTAADFSANDQLARMLGEPEFGALFHQGERESMYLADVARRVILVVLFDNRTTLGLVKLRVKAAVGQLNQVFTDMFNRDGTSAPGVESAFLGEAEDEIDKLFGS